MLDRRLRPVHENELAQAMALAGDDADLRQRIQAVVDRAVRRVSLIVQRINAP